MLIKPIAFFEVPVALAVVVFVRSVIKETTRLQRCNFRKSSSLQIIKNASRPFVFISGTLSIAPATHVSSPSQVSRRLNLYSATCIAKQRVC